MEINQSTTNVGYLGLLIALIAFGFYFCFKSISDLEKNSKINVLSK